MLINEHIRDYIISLEPELPEEIRRIEKTAIRDCVPIIRKETQALLRFLLLHEKPRRILEIGTAIGFSSLFMAQFISESATIDTIEKVEMRLVKARENLKNLSEQGRLRLLEGDADKVLKELNGKYDFIFLDAAKGQYMNFLPDILRILDSGGMLLTDNVLQEGNIAESKYSTVRRDRTIHVRMREFLYALTHDERLQTVVLPVGDGVAITTLNGTTCR